VCAHTVLQAELENVSDGYSQLYSQLEGLALSSQSHISMQSTKIEGLEAELKTRVEITAELEETNQALLQGMQSEGDGKQILQKSLDELNLQLAESKSTIELKKAELNTCKIELAQVEEERNSLQDVAASVSQGDSDELNLLKEELTVATESNTQWQQYGENLDAERNALAVQCTQLQSDLALKEGNLKEVGQKVKELENYEGLLKQEMVSIVTIFLRMDADRSGSISLSELNTSLGEVLVGGALEQMLEVLDDDASGDVSVEEWLTYVAGQKTLHSSSSLHSIAPPHSVPSCETYSRLFP